MWRTRSLRSATCSERNATSRACRFYRLCYRTIRYLVNSKLRPLKWLLHKRNSHRRHNLGMSLHKAVVALTIRHSQSVAQRVMVFSASSGPSSPPTWVLLSMLCLLVFQFRSRTASSNRRNRVWIAKCQCRCNRRVKASSMEHLLHLKTPLLQSCWLNSNWWRFKPQIHSSLPLRWTQVNSCSTAVRSLRSSNRCPKIWVLSWLLSFNSRSELDRISRNNSKHSILSLLEITTARCPIDNLTVLMVSKMAPSETDSYIHRSLKNIVQLIMLTGACSSNELAFNITLNSTAPQWKFEGKSVSEKFLSQKMRMMDTYERGTTTRRWSRRKLHRGKPVEIFINLNKVSSLPSIRRSPCGWSNVRRWQWVGGYKICRYSWPWFVHSCLTPFSPL